MQKLQKRLQATVALGDFFRAYRYGAVVDSALDRCVDKTAIENGWFTREVIELAISNWGKTLTQSAVNTWLDPYNLEENQAPKTIALILAGNIPMVGLHDLLCVWITGHDAVIKCASKDQHLLPFIVQFLKTHSQDSSPKINFTKDKLDHFDAVIATGSDNSARYFKHYFNHVPHIIRKNRNAVAILSGNESVSELEGLGNDLLHFFGMGCRNVSKLLLPRGFDLNKIFGGVYPQSDIINNSKYANNYDYNKAVFLMSEFQFLENGFFILKEDTAIAAPIACAFYEFYDSLASCQTFLEENQDNIQCVVSHLDFKQALPFGKAQQPELWDYADQVDTITFLASLN